MKRGGRPELRAAAGVSTSVRPTQRTTASRCVSSVFEVRIVTK
jgi:hypothetical protein